MTPPYQRTRQYGRIALDQALRGTLDEYAVRVIQVSVTGMLIAHDTRILPVPTRRLRMEWQEKTMDFGCVVTRSTLSHLAPGPAEKSIYHSGVRILEAAGESEKILRDFIAERVIRALEEQKANARGIPPLATYSFQVGKGDRLRRCELVDGVWRKSETTNRQQPENGFTVSAEIDPEHVEMLARTYEQTTTEGRRLTRILAELSISKSEGTPTRRFVP